MYRAFAGMTRVTVIDLTNLTIGKLTTDIREMCAGAQSITSIEITPDALTSGSLAASVVRQGLIARMGVWDLSGVTAATGAFRAEAASGETEAVSSVARFQVSGVELAARAVAQGMFSGHGQVTEASVTSSFNADQVDASRAIEGLGADASTSGEITVTDVGAGAGARLSSFAEGARGSALTVKGFATGASADAAYAFSRARARTVSVSGSLGAAADATGILSFAGEQMGTCTFFGDVARE
ncbi:hypothetical protein, partial [uncultured Adlercreutzia sp.]|uniref:hypothetical protein n=1 Tax=uncultured Adlercreutzia sp. TaxID=875803 RepID=UPI00272DF386